MLMVTGAYYPELAGGALQCQTLIRALGGRVVCRVLSVSTNSTLPPTDVVDGVTVTRVFVAGRGLLQTARASWRVARAFVGAAPRIDVLHLHGFTSKGILLIGLARLMRMPVLLKLTSQDDVPASVKRRGSLAWRAYAHVDRFVATSPALKASLTEAGFTALAVEEIQNGVDLDRFRPATAVEREHARLALGCPEDAIVILFVGMMAAVKRPELLADAWLALGAVRDRTLLVFVGATASRYYEVDPDIPVRIRRAAAAEGVASQVRFIDETPAIEPFYRAADIFVLPSEREGLPNALLEAMASGLPCVASRLSGTTDAVIADGENGILVPSGEVTPLARALAALVENPDRRRELGRRARHVAETRYAIDAVRDEYVRLYSTLSRNSRRSIGGA